MKIAIVGSRNITDYNLFKDYVLSIIKVKDIDLVISGGARGVDTLAERFAKEFNIETQIFPADWNRYGKAAGHIRNKDIIFNSDIVFALWDGKSTGTNNSINHAKNMNKQLHVKIIS